MTVTKKQRETIEGAFLALLAEREWDRIALAEIAARAGVSLAVLHEAFPTRIAIWEAFTRRIDAEVLAADFSDTADEPARERYFDVLMRRLDALRPYRPAIRSVARAARRDPALALELNRIARVSQEWMLAAAGVRASGLAGRVMVQGAVIAFVRVLRTFVREDDPGLPRTMAALDRELRQSEKTFLRLMRWFRRPGRDGEGASRQGDPDAGEFGPDPAVERTDAAAPGAGNGAGSSPT